MIIIKHIHIAFDKVLIEDGTLKVENGKLTAIQGKSGSGKTSLLSVAGLLTKNKYTEYYFNHHLIKQEDEEISLFRKKYIGYVFQDNSLLEHLSIYENLKLYGTMVDRTINEQQAQEILKMVHLDKNVHQTVTKLSGGERQRLAIACALTKSPKLLILDEPTSALDNINRQMIMDILKELALQGMMILIASHDKAVIDQCDIVYQIKDEKLICHPSVSCCQENQIVLNKVKLDFPFYLSYYLNYFKANYWNYLLMFGMCGLAIAILVGSQSISKGYENKQLENMDALGNREIFVTSQKTDSNMVQYSNELPVLDDVTIRRIEKQEDCESCYPFYEGYTYQITYMDQDYSVLCAIQPYAKEKRLSDYLETGIVKEDGVYISSDLAKQLNIEEIAQVELTFTINLPDGNKKEVKNLYVDGILESNVPNWYSEYQSIIYMPIETLPQMEEVKALLVYAAHYDKTESIKAYIEEIDSEAGIYTPFSRTSEIDDALEKMKSYGPFLMIMLVLVCMMMIFLIYSRYISNRKREIILLRVNGLSKKEVVHLIMTELLIQTMVIAGISMCFIGGLYFYISKMMGIEIEIHMISDMILTITLSFIWMAVPSLISLFIFQRYDISEALRND